jgi:aryl-alcohol dehydrogenase-like predicted oxidoreductase
LFGLAWLAATGEGTLMITGFSFLEQVDRICGAFATVLHSTEPKVYAMLALLLILGLLVFPPKNDPDQI